MEGKRVFAFSVVALGLAWPLGAEAQTARGGNKRAAPPVAAAPITGFLKLPHDTAIQRRPRAVELRDTDNVDPGSPPLLRSLAVSDNAEFGLGILSVAGETEKRTVGLRTNPRIDVEPGRTRVAGAGFAIRF